MHCVVKILQATLWVITVAFVDDDIREGLPFLVSLTSGAMKTVKGHDNGTWRGTHP
jgi:hypothetical protein